MCMCACVCVCVCVRVCVCVCMCVCVCVHELPPNMSTLALLPPTPFIPAGITADARVYI